jgi:hypothetical protein
MPNSWLLDTNYNGGLQETHYFDGRLLTADALKADQKAIQTRQNWLGNAAGYGVIEGLAVGKVSTGVAGLSIIKGFGINYTGHILYLPSNMNLTIGKGTPQSSPTAEQTMKKPGTFASAHGQTATNGKAAGTVPSTGNLPEGVYLLTILPARTKFEGLAPMRSGVGGVSSGISNLLGGGSKWEVEGVQFKAIRLDTSDLSGLFQDVQDIKIDDKGNLRQNLLAHWCYGTLTVRNFGIHPFGFPDVYSPLDPNASDISDLSKDDLPLAVFHWDGSQIVFVDQWAVRRRVIHPRAVTGTWKAVMDDRRVADNQARFRQFQDQLDSIISSGSKPNSSIDLTAVKVTNFFTFLPPVGFLPVTQESLQKLLCPHLNDDKKHEKSKEQGQKKEQEGTKSGSDFQLTLSDAELRMLGEFAGGAAGALLNTVFPAAGLVSTTGGILTRAVGALGSLLHLGSSEPALAGQDLGTIINTIEDLFQRVQALEGKGQPSSQQERGTKATGEQQQPSSQQSTLQVSVHREKPEKALPEHTHPSQRVRFHERICATLSWPRKNPHGTERSKTEGFNLATFFDGYLLRISLIGKDRIDLLMNESWYEDAIDLRPDRHPDPSVGYTGEPAYSVEKGLHPMPLLFDIYLVEENLLDTSQPLYVIFHKSLHPVELIRYYKHQQQTLKDPPLQEPTSGPIM